MVNSVGRAAGWSTAGLYVVCRSRREQSVGKWGNQFQDVAGYFFLMKLQGTTASSLFLKTDKAVTPCSILILPDVSFGCMTVSGSFINVMDSVCS